MKGQGKKVLRLHPLKTMNMCTKSQNNRNSQIYQIVVEMAILKLKDYNNVSWIHG